MALVFALVFPCAADEPPMVNGRYPVNPELYRLMVEHGFLPTKTTVLSNEEIAQKFDLSLPQMAEVKSALDKNDAAGLEKALVAYLNSKLPPFKPADPPKPVPGVNSPIMRGRPDAWLGKEITFYVNGEDKTYTVGEEVNWYNNVEGGPDITFWSTWGNTLAEAYLASGDPKYAEGILTYVRSFYKNCRPPVELRRPIFWSGAMGPWAMGGGGRVTGFLQWIYRVIGGASVTTDDDRLMFLKMVYEHGECVYLFSEEHHPHNFEFYPILVLAKLSGTFPEFKESEAWRERSIERVQQNMDDAMLDDGGAHERTTYNFSYPHSYTQLYRQLRDTGVLMPESFRRKLEPMYEWEMWILSPLHQYPVLNSGGLDDMSGYFDPSMELFPDRADFQYFASYGARGKPSARTARVLYHTGFLTMRSDWSRDALYMAMNYNGSLPEIGTAPQLLSFGVWAHGRVYMNNVGTPVGYTHPLWNDCCAHTKAFNTVVVDGESQLILSNGGWLENWQDLSGFTYLASATDNYRHLGVRHRRAVLFVKPRPALSGAEGYWLMSDRLSPVDKAGIPIPAGKSHEYRWQGHFQPMELTVDAESKTVATSVKDGKRLYLIPAQPNRLQLEQGKGMIVASAAPGTYTYENPPVGPIISLVQKSEKPVSFTVLLYPTTNNAPTPVLTSITVMAGNQPVKDDSAVGVRIRHDASEEVIAMAETAGLRDYGPLTTDGESGYVRTEQGRVVEAGLVGGQKLTYAGETLMEVGPDIVSAHVLYAGDEIHVQVKGNGKLSVAAHSEKRFVLNSQSVRASKRGWWWKPRWETNVPSPGTIEFSAPTFSTDSFAVFKAVAGITYRGSEKEIYVGPTKSLIVSWKTSVPSDAIIEYTALGSGTWFRTVNPEPMTDHRFVLSRLTPGTTYQIRLRCGAEDGRIGKTELTYLLPELKP